MIKKEYKIALLVMVALAVLIWGFHFMKGRNLLLKGDRYYAVYSQVVGLNEGGPVYYKGFKVGSVQSIELHPVQKRRFLISFILTEDLPLPANTIAQLYSVDLMGSKAIQLQEGDSEALLVPGDTLKTNVMGDLIDQMGMEVLPLKDKAERLLVRLDTVMTNIGEVFSDRNKKSLDMAIYDFTITMQNIQEMTSKLNQSLEPNGEITKSLENIQSFTGTLSQQADALSATMQNLEAITNGLRKADMQGLVTQADSTLATVQTVLSLVAEGEGSAGLLLNDPKLYYNLTDASANLDRLLADVRHNPERYVSFSAINLGRKIYVNADEDLADKKDIVFKIKIDQSQKPLDDLRNKIVLGEYPVFEDTNGQQYIYTVGETNSYSKALFLLDKLLPEYPSASLLAFRKGQPIKVKKALRKVNLKN
ncbi:MlaD family protein [Geofilum sp. OHC36d9]|uniref:MlaD family protein n=1 Tax=Geofilum sp. OHC36d9 TaxID=3458413 RepID=UPI0040349173